MNSNYKKIKVFAPASISNLGPGFDVLGFTIEELGDLITLSLRDDGEYIIEAKGADLPRHPDKNVATVAIRSLAKKAGYQGGFNITIEKNFPPGSGLGSSASSACGAVYAANQLLGMGLSPTELIPFALDGEEFASGNRHGDNVIPCLLGGLVAVRSCDPFEGFHVPVPEGMEVLIVLPDVQIKTGEARAILPDQIPMSAGITQAANMAGLIKGLMSADYDLIRSAMVDQFAQPFRSKLIPLFDKVKHLMTKHNSLGFTISGSGPAMFGFFRKEDDYTTLRQEIETAYLQHHIKVRFYACGINEKGVEIM